MAHVYILQSIRNSQYYIGSTADIKTRMHSHNSGGVKATKNLLPLNLLFKQEYPDYDTARQIETRIKKLKRRDYIEKIIKEGRIKIKLTDD